MVIYCKISNSVPWSVLIVFVMLDFSLVCTHRGRYTLIKSEVCVIDNHPNYENRSINRVIGPST